MSSLREDLRSRWRTAQPLLTQALTLCREGGAWAAALADLPFSGEVDGRRDLRGAPLAGANLAGADLTGADLAGADLRGTDLSEASLIRANLSEVRATEATFWRAELVETVFEGADLAKANFYEANLARACLAGATLDEAYLERVSMGSAALRGASLFGARLKGAAACDADLSGVHAEGADLAEADLSGANLQAADLAGAVLGRATLTRATMRGCSLAGADLSGSELTGADLVGADLEDCDLSRATLGEANLASANLRRADLREARLAGANLRAATLEQAVLVGADLEGAKLAEARAAGANVTGANCRKSVWADADVAGACFEHAALYGSSIFLARGLDSVNAGEVDLHPDRDRTSYVRWTEAGEALRALLGRTARVPEAPPLAPRSPVPRPPPAFELDDGCVFGRYVIEGKLGEGGMGRVYRALDPRLGRRVALKILLAGERTVDVAQSTMRLEREARATAQLDSPHAVSVFDVGEAQGTPYIAMELVVGRALSFYVGKKRPGWSTRVRWLAQTASALAAAHRLGIVHRDVKPENVMVRDDGFVKVLDFGMARRAMAAVDAQAASLDTLASLTLEGAIVGTPLYMAPEQIKGTQIDGRTDQFAWAVTGYELLTGRSPWSGNSFAVLAKILTEEPAPIRAASPRVPEEVAAVVERAMSKDAEARFPRMDSIVAALAPFAAVADEGQGGASEPPPAA
jgi:serine/threonine-protein kinase